MIDVNEGGLTERAQRLALDDQHIPAHHFLDLDAADIELAIGRLVRSERKQRCVLVRRGDLGRRVHGKLRQIARSAAVIAPVHANGKHLLEGQVSRNSKDFGQSPVSDCG
jgi:hypothetical protein